MDTTLHYLLMKDHLTFHKMLSDSIKDTQLTPGQPKILDYLASHNGAIQKDIASYCCIKQATLTSVLAGMESKGLIERRSLNGNRRNLYVFLTDKGAELAARVEQEFIKIEQTAFMGFQEKEKRQLVELLERIKNNL